MGRTFKLVMKLYSKQFDPGTYIYNRVYLQIRPERRDSDPAGDATQKYRILTLFSLLLGVRLSGSESESPPSEVGCGYQSRSNLLGIDSRKNTQLAYCW